MRNFPKQTFAGALLAAFSSAALAQSPSIPPSPSWTRALPVGPDTRVKITEEYAGHVARDAYFWGWPLAGVYNRRLATAKNTQLAYAGPVPSAPVNRLVMLTDYVAADERLVACPNQDVAYGGGSLGLEVTPVVIQVPDFGNRFWVYQAVDTRTDSFAKLGKMYGTTPGFYLLVGPNWQGEVPKGITQIFRASTNTGFVAPRIFMDDTPEDRQAIQPVLQQIMMYPLSEYDGTMKSIDWSTIPKLPNEATGDAEVKWVRPETFFDELPAILVDAPPLPGEEARYAQIHAVLEAAKTLKFNDDGSLTIYVQAEQPPEAQRANWLPAPKGWDFSLYVRAYWPKTAITDGSWTPPPVQRVN